jgi:tetratricopeptide (TPR) repeat protein
MSKLLCALVSCLFLAPVLSAESTPHWIEIRSDHFTVVTDDSEKEGRHLAGQFERMRALFHLVLPNASSDAPSPIIIIAPKDRKGFEALEPPEYLQKNSLTLAGYFERTEDQNYILLRLDAEQEVHPFATVYHEYTHFVVRKAEYLPIWLNEGLAQFYQNTDIRDKDVTLGEPSANDILYLREQKLLPLATLFAVDHNSPYYHDEDKGSVFYSESWALTHMLEVEDFKAKTVRIGDYARLLKAGGDPVQAAQQVFGDLKQLQKRLDSYIEQGSYAQFHIKSGVTIDEASFKSQPITLNDANAIRADVLSAIGRKPEAQKLLDNILSEDPKNALAAESMGSLCLREQNDACAKKWFGQAIETDSASYLAHFYYGMMLFRDGGEDQNAAIESNLQTAIKLNPLFADSYQTLAEFYSMRQNKLNEAYILMLHAIQIEPEEMRYRMNAAEIQMRRDQPENALLSLATAAKLAKTPRERAMIEERIASIKHYQSSREEVQTVTAAPSTSTDVIGIDDVKGATPPSETPGSKATAGPKHVPSSVVVVTSTDGPTEEHKYPVAAANAPHHTVKGTLRDVKCSYPTVITMTLVSGTKTINLYAPNFFRVPFTLLNFKVEKDLDPCTKIEGMKASIDYAEISDKEVSGQIISVELQK